MSEELDICSAEYQEKLRKGLQEYFASVKDELDAAEERILSIDISNPKFQCVNPPGWENMLKLNTDGYGRAVLVFAHEWARLMEYDILRSAEKTFDALTKEQIEESERLADNVAGGITGFMYGAAVHSLSQVWRFGKELQKYHNKSFGCEDAEGTVNPAVITVG